MKLVSASIAISAPIRRVLWSGIVDATETAEESRVGLSRASRLDANTGMLFGANADTAMTMRDTSMPLDMLFIDSRGSILSIVTAPARSRELYKAPPNAALVLEIQGGLSAKKGIAPGAVATFRKL